MTVDKKEFPNGFMSWQETYYEIVAEITQSINMGNLSEKVVQIQKTKGRRGLCELAEELTDKFEQKKYKGRFWDGEFHDKIDDFLKEELYE